MILSRRLDYTQVFIKMIHCRFAKNIYQPNFDTFFKWNALGEKQVCASAVHIIHFTWLGFFLLLLTLYSSLLIFSHYFSAFYLNSLTVNSFISLITFLRVFFLFNRFYIPRHLQRRPYSYSISLHVSSISESTWNNTVPKRPEYTTILLCFL